MLSLYVARGSAAASARSLMELTRGASTGELAALEELVATFVSKGDISNALVRRG